MTLNRGAQRAIVAGYFAFLAAVYGMAWFLPSVGLSQEDATHLITARALATHHGYVVDSLPVPVSETSFPPFFPAILGLFTLVSQAALLLKLLPLACAAGWLGLTRKLLLKMGASRSSALLLVALTAASPMVVFISTSLLPQTLFALLATAALLELLEERALLAGLFAGLATLTQSSGVALVIACILTLVARRKFRGAGVFALVAMAIVAPWFGWSLAHITHDPGVAHSPLTIFTGLAASEKLVVLAHNFVSLFATPYSLLTSFASAFTAIGALAIAIWCIFLRRQLVPDLFVGLYCLSLLCFVTDPERLVAPVFPLFLWMVWRVLRLLEVREALFALVLIAMAAPLVADVLRLIRVRASGYLATRGEAPDEWEQLQGLSRFIRANTPADSTLLANMDGFFFLNTGRKTVRGFPANSFDLYYSDSQSPVTPDQLLRSITRSDAAYLVLTPDRGLPESPSFHRSVEALQRGGVIEPVSVPGEAAGYDLYKVTGR